MVRVCKKSRRGQQEKFRDEDNNYCFPQVLFPHGFTPNFHFHCVACATFDLIHSADQCFLVMHARVAKNPFEPP